MNTSNSASAAAGNLESDRHSGVWSQDEGMQVDWESSVLGSFENLSFAAKPKVSLKNATPDAEVLDEGGINHLMESTVAQLQESTGLSADQCLALLRTYKWKPSRIIEDYLEQSSLFLQKQKMLKLDASPPNLSEGGCECLVCFGAVLPTDDVPLLDCRHRQVCGHCWVQYLTNAASSRQCLAVKCPVLECGVSVPSSAWFHSLRVAAPNALARYLRFGRDDFVQNYEDTSHCPSPRCDGSTVLYVNGSADISSLGFDAHCPLCKARFCWQCKAQAHFACSCELSLRWREKNSSESENIRWLLAQTKKCPRCGVNIEKNQGCNHMTCDRKSGGCGHDFCWLCKQPWAQHGEATGGFYACNVYQEATRRGQHSAEEINMEKARTELKRFQFHFGRFDSHMQSALFTQAEIEGGQIQLKMAAYVSTHKCAMIDAQFIADAAEEAIRCWRLLAWTYPIVYFLDESEFNADLFKMHQGFLEKFCNGLQELLDFGSQRLACSKARQELTHYTMTSANYRRNLIQHIQNDLL